jgi:hypothetical protein
VPSALVSRDVLKFEFLRSSPKWTPHTRLNTGCRSRVDEVKFPSPTPFQKLQKGSREMSFMIDRHVLACGPETLTTGNDSRRLSSSGCFVLSITKTVCLVW